MEIFKLTTYIFLLAIKVILCSSSSVKREYPEIHHQNFTRSEKLDPNGILNLQWYLRNNNEIVFHVTLNSRGFFAIGFSNPRIKGSDIVVAWVNDKTAKANILVIFEIYFIVNLTVFTYRKNVTFYYHLLLTEEKTKCFNALYFFCTFPFYYYVSMTLRSISFSCIYFFSMQLSIMRL